MFENYDCRIVNLRYTVAGLRFDAAIDCNWTLHAYEENPERMSRVVPIELYCFDRIEWDIKMIYFDKGKQINNAQPIPGQPLIHHTICNFDFILEGTKEWIFEMTGKPVTEDVGNNNIEELF